MPPNRVKYLDIYTCYFAGHSSIVELLLERGADYASTDINGALALHYAAQNDFAVSNYFLVFFFCMKRFEWHNFPNCLCGIRTRQLELLLWRAGLTAQHMQYSPVFFIQLNYVHNNKNKVLPPYGKFPFHKVAQHWPCKANIEQKLLGCQACCPEQ